jgi:hypothetical protein
LLWEVWTLSYLLLKPQQCKGKHSWHLHLAYIQTLTQHPFPTSTALCPWKPRNRNSQM